MLAIDSLDDLKSRIGKVIMMILIVKFFELAISMSFDDVYDLLMFSAGIVLVGGSLFLTEFDSGHHNKKVASDPDREVWTPEKRAEKMEEMRTEMKNEARKEILQEKE